MSRHSMALVELNLSGNSTLATVPLLEMLGEMAKRYGLEALRLAGCNIDATKAAALMNALRPGFSAKLRQLENEAEAARDRVHQCVEDAHINQDAYASALEYIQSIPGAQLEDLQTRLSVAASQLDDIKKRVAAKKRDEAEGKSFMEDWEVAELHAQLQEASARHTELQEELSVRS